jgi:hypothetical protein
VGASGTTESNLDSETTTALAREAQALREIERICKESTNAANGSVTNAREAAQKGRAHHTTMHPEKMRSPSCSEHPTAARV